MWKPTIRRLTIWKPEILPVTPEDAETYPAIPLNESPALQTSEPHPGEWEPDQTLTRSAAPMTWRFTRSWGVFASDPTNPEYKRLPEFGTWMFDSEADLDAAFDVTRDQALQVQEHMQLELDKPPKRDAIWAGEWDSWKKITHQNGRIIGSRVVQMGPAVVDVDDTWNDVLRRVLTLMRASAVPTPLTASPFATNAGWPCMTQGFLPKLIALMLASGTTYRQIEDESVEFCHRIGLPSATAQAFALSFRTGPLYKASPYYAPAGGGTWKPSYMGLGMWPRARQVFMASYGNTMALEKLFMALQAGRRGISGLWHGGDRDKQEIFYAYSQGWNIQESDISGFDLSVSPRMQDALADGIAETWPELAHEAFIWRYYEGRSVLAPARTLDPGWTLTTTRGATHSGQRLTAEIGTLITVVTTLAVMTKILKSDALTAWRKREFMLLVQGDDVLLGLPGTLDPEQWEEEWAVYGLKCSLLNSSRFLAKHRLSYGTFPVGGRIVQQTLSNENEPPRHIPGPDMDPLLVLGLKARWADGPPPPLVPLVQKCIQMTGLAQRTGVYDGPTADTWLKTPANAGRLEETLRKMAKSPWLERVRKDAPFSPSAAYMLETLEETGLITAETEDSATKNALLRKAGLAYRTKPWATRLEAAVRYFEMTQRTPSPNDEEAITQVWKDIF